MNTLSRLFSRTFAVFSFFIVFLIVLNLGLFAITFYGVIHHDYGPDSPSVMLQKTAETLSGQHISPIMEEPLRQAEIWAMVINDAGKVVSSAALPPEIPDQFSLGDVAVFSRGYLHDYPVFVRRLDHGLLVLGYPKNSYIKLTSNYYSYSTLTRLPLYVLGTLLLDLILLFTAYILSKIKVQRAAGPLISALNTFPRSQRGTLSTRGELAAVAASVNQAAELIHRQNEARANWIRGVTHDLRTPLSMILGYADRIAHDPQASPVIQAQARIIQKQSVKIKDLIQDLTLVSQLEYEMQPLRKQEIHLARLLRTIAADTLNAGLADVYSLDLDISKEAEDLQLACDPRLIRRAIGNLIGNSVAHNPQGCSITLKLETDKGQIILTAADDGIGLSDAQRQNLEETPHYLESIDERLDLRHGLGLILVRQITEVHGGTMKIESGFHEGFRVTLTFPRS